MIEGRTLSVDLETTGLDVHRDYICAVGVYDVNRDIPLVFPCYQGLIPEECRNLLNAAETWITHSGTTFDLHLLKREGVHWPKTHYDTLLGELIFATESKADFSVSLANTMKRRIGEDNKLTVSHGDWGLVTPLTQHQIDYVIGDVSSLHRIKDAQEIEASKKHMNEAMTKEQKLSLVTAQVMYNGMAFDAENLDAHLRAYTEEARGLKILCEELYGKGFNPNSYVQVIEGLKKYGINVKNTELVTLMTEACSSKRKENIILPIIKYRQAHHKIAMYKPEKMKTRIFNGRLYGQYKQLGAATARYTSQQPNLQQIPVKMRDMIGGEEGLVVVAPDYAQIEIRVKSYIAQDTDLQYTLKYAEDFHAEMAMSMFPESNIYKEEGGGWHDNELRDQGKGGSFTYCFGGGAKGIQNAAIEKGVVIQDSVARGMIQGLDARFPISAAFHEVFRAFQKAGQPKRLTLPWNHYREYAYPRATQMINNYVQGFAALGYKEALLEAARRNLVRQYIGGLNHDEFVATSVPKAYAMEYARELEDAMIEGMSRVIPRDMIKVETKVGTHWSK